MDPSLQPLLTRLERLSDEFREIREGIEKAVQVAKVDPEMALTRARKVLELVVREIFQRRVNEPPGTRPLENLIQRLVKDGYFPDRLDAYASTIRKLGNVGTHSFGEGVTRTDVRLSLTQQMPILDWYFQVERPDAVVPPAETSARRTKPPALAAPADKRSSPPVRATPPAIPRKPSGRPPVAPPVVPESMRKGRATVARAMKTADAQQSRKWLIGPLPVVLLLAGLLVLIIGFALKNRSSSAHDTAPTVANASSMKVESNAAPTVDASKRTPRLPIEWTRFPRSEMWESKLNRVIDYGGVDDPGMTLEGALNNLAKQYDLVSAIPS